jgi:hypothetical protein
MLADLAQDLRNHVWLKMEALLYMHETMGRRVDCNLQPVPFSAPGSRDTSQSVSRMNKLTQIIVWMRPVPSRICKKPQARMRRLPTAQHLHMGIGACALYVLACVLCVWLVHWCPATADVQRSLAFTWTLNMHTLTSCEVLTNKFRQQQRQNETASCLRTTNVWHAS